jgi:cyanate lyase
VGARHALATAVPVDPTIYEVLQVYGPTIKELIHEQVGDGIVSAISGKLSMSDAAGLFE